MTDTEPRYRATLRFTDETVVRSPNPVLRPWLHHAAVQPWGVIPAWDDVLDLPDGVAVRAVRWEPWREVTLVLVEGGGLAGRVEPWQPDTEPPYLPDPASYIRHP